MRENRSFFRKFLSGGLEKVENEFRRFTKKKRVTKLYAEHVYKNVSGHIVKLTDFLLFTNLKEQNLITMFVYKFLASH